LFGARCVTSSLALRDHEQIDEAIGDISGESCASLLGIYIVLVLTGYFHGMRNNTIIEPQTIKKHEEQVGSYCDAHLDTTLMDAVKNVLGFDK